MARHHLRVNRVGDTRPAAHVLRDQAQVADVGEVFVRPRLLAGAGQDRLDHATHALFAQLVGQVVDMGVAAQDQPLLRVQDGCCRDRAFAVAARLVAEAGIVAQRVHQPRLAGGALPDQRQRTLGERLPGLCRMLRGQRVNLLLGEVAEPQRFRLDIERAAAEHQAVLGSRMDAVVAHVTHPAQDDAVRKALRAVDVPRAQLAQHRQQGVAHQRVDLIDQQHQRTRIGHAPAQQRLAQGLSRPYPLQHPRPELIQRLVTQRHARLERQFGKHGAHALGHVLPHCLAVLDVGVHAAEVALRAAVQQVAQRQQRGGLAGLPRRMQHEVFLFADQTEHFIKVDPR